MHFENSAGAVKRICILGPGFGTNNMGLDALTTGTVSSALHAFPEVKLWLLDYDDQPVDYETCVAGGRVKVPMVNVAFSKKVWRSNHMGMLLLLALLGRAIPSASLRRKFLARNRWLRLIQESDLVVGLAGGDSFSDIYGQERLWYVSLPQILALVMQRRLILLPQTIGPFRTATGCGVARFILRRAKRIYARDQASLGEVARLLGHKPANAAFAYDMGFALDPMPPTDEVREQLQKIRERGEMVGLNVSGLLYCGGYTRANQFGLKGDYREMIQRLIRYFTVDQRVQVLLVPHVLGPPTDMESDITACAQVARDAGPAVQGRLHVLPGTVNHHQVKWSIGQCDFFLGSRMHACIAAVSQAVPALGLAYSRKFAGVFGSMGVEDLVVDLCKLDSDAVFKLVAERFQQRAELKRRLQAVAPKLRALVLDLFKDINRNLANPPGADAEASRSPATCVPASAAGVGPQEAR